MVADLTLVLVTTMGLGLARACPVPTTTRKGFDIGVVALAEGLELQLPPLPQDPGPEAAAGVGAPHSLGGGAGSDTEGSWGRWLTHPWITSWTRPFTRCTTSTPSSRPASRLSPQQAPGPRSHFQYQLHWLQEAPKKVSDPGRGWMPGPWVRRRLTPGQWETTFSSLPQEFQDGLKASVTFILFHLLTWDLNC
ncbi:hypothetical protein DBR06_SOUSAS1610288, partial [Sousa chinensis]